MRKLSPTKAISHALKSVWGYRQVAIRIAIAWLPVLLLCSIAEIYFVPVNSGETELPMVHPVQIATFFISLLAASSISANWQRFILRDDVGRGLRIDGDILRYAVFSFLLLVATVIPTALLLATTLVVPSMTVFAVPAVALIAGIVTRLSIRFPAIALGSRTFTFRDAWTASAGNFWPCLGVFLMVWAITLGVLFVLLLLGSGIGLLNERLGELAIYVGLILIQPFYSVFNASVITSLYGFFVERREF